MSVERLALETVFEYPAYCSERQGWPEAVVEVLAYSNEVTPMPSCAKTRPS